MEAFYIGYQGDFIDVQAIKFLENEDAADTEKIIVGTARAVLLGWWFENGRLSCLPDVFVVRATSDGWKLFEVKFTSERLLEAVVQPTEHESSDLKTIPTGWPCLNKLPFWKTDEFAELWDKTKAAPEDAD